MAATPSIHDILKTYWGFDQFRPKQEEIIQSVIDGKDTLALLPTGGGKSICFQIPSLAQEGLCLVISPLIALMQDQVQNLKAKGVKALMIHSAMSRREIDITLDNAAYGDYKFLYLSPERLETELFQARLKKMNINLVAVDEAHCISQWGYDFRPSYLNIAALKEQLVNVPFIALTATATTAVVQDIQEKLLFRKSNVIQKSFLRKNLAYVVRKTENIITTMFKVIDGIGGSGIIYTTTRKRTKEIANVLLQHDLKADYYHAGLSSDERQTRQRNWISNKTQIIVATNAFGMGIDKADVRFVIHVDLPSSLEAYFQEAGRAGRDEKKAFAVLLVSPSMIGDLKQKTELEFPEIEFIKKCYLSLSNYFQIPIHGGLNQSYDFDIRDFSNKYKLNVSSSYRALHFIEKEGLISLSENFSTPSKVNIVLTKQDFYKFQVAHKIYDYFLKTLLRTYGGLMEGYVSINENELAGNLKSNKNKVIETLLRLQKLKVIDYIPKGTLPKITYTRQRVDHVHISKVHYEERKKITFEQVNSVAKYAENESVCRSNTLLNYFAETIDSSCGVCDVCLRKKKANSAIDFDSLEIELLEKIKEGPKKVDELLLGSKHQKKLAQLLDFYTDSGKLKFDGLFYSLN
ncbi:MAG: ATP-dependent DNA helicase RecQ [Vicingaceae bacterium]|jgi:ATP-dependent DNA helicase RecQ